jgi:hypothetical protein
MPVDLRGRAEQVRDVIGDALKEAVTTVEGGPMDGVRVITEEKLHEVLWQTLPPASEHSADVRTPARVVVTTYCPQCNEPGSIAVTLTPELRVDPSGASLRLQGKSKPAPHQCGQTVLALGAVDGQGSFELTDIVGDSQGDDDEEDNTEPVEPKPE